jgi:hypothetical protein
MKTRRRILLIASLPLAIAATLFMLMPGCVVSGSGVTMANFDEIKKGMTAKEVETLLGKQGTLVSPGSNRVPPTWLEHPVNWVYWTNTEGESAYVGFVDGLVTDRFWEEAGRSHY